MKLVNVSVKLIISAKKIITGILANVVVKMANIWKLLLTIQKLCDGIIYVMDIFMDIIPINMTTNSDGKKYKISFKKLVLKVQVLFFDEKTEFGGSGFDNILIDKKLYWNILAFDSYTKPWLVQNHCILDSIK